MSGLDFRLFRLLTPSGASRLLAVSLQLSGGGVGGVGGVRCVLVWVLSRQGCRCVGLWVGVVSRGGVTWGVMLLGNPRLEWLLLPSF